MTQNIDLAALLPDGDDGRDLYQLRDVGKMNGLADHQIASAVVPVRVNFHRSWELIGAALNVSADESKRRFGPRRYSVPNGGGYDLQVLENGTAHWVGNHGGSIPSHLNNLEPPQVQALLQEEGVKPLD